jgi:hypothetical protein
MEMPSIHPQHKIVKKIMLVIDADLLPPMVAMHAYIVLGLCEHDIPTACDVESRR